MTTTETGQRRARTAAIWSLGDYAGLAELLLPAARALVARLDPDHDRRVVDVAAGTGNVAVLAARAGAQVTAVDIAPGMIEIGRRRTAHLDVEWVEADLQELPLPDGGADAVVSAFGLIFAPDPPAALRELRRLLAPNGRLLFAVWARCGFMADMEPIFAEHVPGYDPAASMLRWGARTRLEHWLAECFAPPAITEHRLSWAFDTPDRLTAFLRAHSPGHISIENAIGEQAADAMFAEIERVASLDGGAVELDLDYLVVEAVAR